MDAVFPCYHSSENIALSMARLVEPHDQPDERQSACKRIVEAMFDEPYLIGGKGRFDTRILQACRGHAIVKLVQRGSTPLHFQI